VLATALGAAGIGYTAGQLNTATDSVQEQVQTVKARPKNDCQVGIVVSNAKAQAVADFLDQKFAELDPAFNPAENGIKNLSARVALASDPSGAKVGHMTQFRLPSSHAAWLKTQADAVTGVEIGAIEECPEESLWGAFQQPDIDGVDGGAPTPRPDVVRPYKSMDEFLGSQSPKLTAWEDPDLP
jgi:hypothetical protein